MMWFYQVHSCGDLQNLSIYLFIGEKLLPLACNESIWSSLSLWSMSLERSHLVNLKAHFEWGLGRGKGSEWQMQDQMAEGEVWGVSFLHLLICTLPRVVCGESFWARHGGTWDHSWGMEWDDHMDSQKVLHRADSGIANPPRLNTSSLLCATSWFTFPSQAASNRQENTLTTPAGRYFLQSQWTFFSPSESRTELFPFNDSLPSLLNPFAWILTVVKQHYKPCSHTSDISYCHCC